MVGKVWHGFCYASFLARFLYSGVYVPNWNETAHTRHELRIIDNIFIFDKK